MSALINLDDFNKLVNENNLALENGLQQNTQEWLDLRSRRVGASDAGAIMGVSPHNTAYETWLQKLNFAENDISEYIAKKGHKLEAVARLEFEKMTGNFVMPAIAFSDTHPWMMASLDGIDVEKKVVVEIKFAGYEDHELAKEGKVPEKYYPQVQHQLFVCKLQKMHYFSFNGTEGVIVDVQRDDKYIEKLLKKEKDFWDCMCDYTTPALSDRDYRYKENEQWDVIAKELLDIRDKLKEYEFLQKRENALKQRLIDMSEGFNCRGSGIKLSRSLRKGAVEYSKVPALIGVNLDRYRKDPIECWRIMEDNIKAV